MLAQTYTDGFLVLHRGQIVAERYFNGMAPEVPHLLMSVSKSMTAAVAGALAGRGALEVSAQLDQIVPELADTSFAGATVQQLLDMRTGTRFRRTTPTWMPTCGVTSGSICGAPRRWPAPADAIGYFATLRNDGPHGGPFRYRSILTDVLAWVIERAAGERLVELIARELWQPMGAEFDAEITVDAHGNPMADGGISATLRDVRHFGRCAAPRRGGGAGGPGRLDRRHDPGRARRPGGLPGRGQPARLPGRRPYRNCWWVRIRRPLLPRQRDQRAARVRPRALATVVAKLSTWPTALSNVMLGA